MSVSHAGLSIVIPIYNEEETLDELYRRLSVMAEGLDLDVEIVFVDDGSWDRSAEIIQDFNSKDPRVHLVQLSRNFGHQIAVTAGLDFARGAAVVILDGDLQDPPELVPEMVAKWQEGYEVVYAMRERRDHESWLMTTTRKAFYRFINRISDLDIPLDAGDFRLISSRALKAMRSLREYSRYVRGISTWVGFKQCAVTYHRPSRHAGESKYSLFRLGKLALAGITAFSRWPLHLLFIVGLSVASLSFLSGIVALILKLVQPDIVEGWTSMIIFISFISGVNLLAIGIMADYIGRIFDEVKGRPIYVVGNLTGFDETIPTMDRMIYCPPQPLASPPEKQP
ncbi:glycosyltransferase family 2 protein [Magnetospira sp. QH-2]|uniref:glycosyltransferase family 2 protein n=1 Tax=Magnetospira sp. (strain QH-2) TaxID=1288970 RepID=UPI0003E81328|nr:glycosyltransferase family 2 protein [Magnetospira sp. QH-2]CCQ75460.1 putative GT2 [Magnetospira sp. QH-2]